MPRGHYVRKKKGATSNPATDGEIPLLTTPVAKRTWTRRTQEASEQSAVSAKTVVIKIGDTTLMLTIAEVPK